MPTYEEIMLGLDHWVQRAKKAEARLAELVRPRSTTTTRKAKALLEFIEGYIAENGGVAPSFDEMKVAMNLKSKSGIHRLVTSLEGRGKLKRLHYRARAMEVVQQ